MIKITRLRKLWSMMVLIALTQPALAISAEDAAAKVSSMHNGRILDVKSAQQQGRAVFVIKVITQDSRVIVVSVDADSGQVLR